MLGLWNLWNQFFNTFGYLLSQIRLSVVRPSSSVVCNVRAPYTAGWNFRQCFYAILYFGRPLTSTQNFTEIVPGKPLRRGLNAKGVTKYRDFGPVEVRYLLIIYRDSCRFVELKSPVSMRNFRFWSVEWTIFCVISLPLISDRHWLDIVFDKLTVFVLNLRFLMQQMLTRPQIWRYPVDGMGALPPLIFSIPCLSLKSFEQGNPHSGWRTNKKGQQQYIKSCRVHGLRGYSAPPHISEPPLYLLKCFS